MNFGNNNLMWILVLLLILGEGGNGGCAGCDTLIWLLLLSRYCGNDDNMGCGCAWGGSGNIGRTCGVWGVGGRQRGRIDFSAFLWYTSRIAQEGRFIYGLKEEKKRRVIVGLSGAWTAPWRPCF